MQPDIKKARGATAPPDGRARSWIQTNDSYSQLFIGKIKISLSLNA